MPSENPIDKIFSIPTRADWARAAEKENEGKNPDETLNWKVGTIEGRAYYDKHDRPENSFQLFPGRPNSSYFINHLVSDSCLLYVSQHLRNCKKADHYRKELLSMMRPVTEE